MRARSWDIKTQAYTEEFRREAVKLSEKPSELTGDG